MKNDLNLYQQQNRAEDMPFQLHNLLRDLNPSIIEIPSVNQVDDIAVGKDLNTEPSTINAFFEEVSFFLILRVNFFSNGRQ